MALSWSARRKSLYSSVAIIIAFIVIVVFYETFFTATPTCFDGKQNGDETGVDCGGSCSLLCQDTAHEPVVLWSRSFNTGGGYYTAAAYIQNNNVGAGARQVIYSFQLFDDKNLLITEKDGVADLPPVQTIPIIEPNINVGNRVVSRTLFAFADTPPAVWYKIPAATIPTIHVIQQNISPDASRLSATIANNTVNDAKNITVEAALFDSQGIARAASKSFIPAVASNSSQDVFFTWPGGVPDIVRAEVTVLPSF